MQRGARARCASLFEKDLRADRRAGNWRKVTAKKHRGSRSPRHADKRDVAWPPDGVRDLTPDLPAKLETRRYNTLQIALEKARARLSPPLRMTNEGAVDTPTRRVARAFEASLTPQQLAQIATPISEQQTDALLQIAADFARVEQALFKSPVDAIEAALHARIRAGDADSRKVYRDYLLERDGYRGGGPK